MAECFKCGVEENSAKMNTVISKKGLVKMCDKCLREDDLPVVSRPSTSQLKEVERKEAGGVYERLSKIAGVDPVEHRKMFSPEKRKQSEALKKQEVSLRDLVDKTFKKDFKPSSYPKEDLIHNFHWIMMRARRARKLTQEQFAKEIGESKVAIEMAEKGKLPSDYVRFLKKVEGYLRIKLLKIDSGEFHSLPEDLGFDRKSGANITIAELREMKAKKDTNDMLEEEKEEEDLNLGGKEELRKKKSWFSGIFGKKKKEVVPVDEDIDLSKDLIFDENEA